METVWNFIEERSAADELKDQLHAIWYLCINHTSGHLTGFYRYCIPMEGSRPLLPAELEFFAKGTGNGKALSPAFCAPIQHNLHMY